MESVSFPNEILDLIIASIPDSESCNANDYKNDTKQLVLCRLVSRRFLHLASKYYVIRRPIALCWLPHGDNFEATRLKNLLSSPVSTIEHFITSVDIKGNTQLVDVDCRYTDIIISVLARLEKLKDLTIYRTDWSFITRDSISSLRRLRALRSFTWHFTRFRSLDNMIQTIFQITPQIDQLEIKFVECYQHKTPPCTAKEHSARMAHAQRLGLAVENSVLRPILDHLFLIEASFKDIQISCPYASDDDMEAVTGLFEQCGERLQSVELILLDKPNGTPGSHQISFAHNKDLETLQLCYRDWEMVPERDSRAEGIKKVDCPGDAISIISTIRPTCFSHLTIRFDLGEVDEAEVAPAGFKKLDTLLARTFGVKNLPKVTICLALDEECFKIMEAHKERFLALLGEQLKEVHKQSTLIFSLEKYAES